MCGRYVSVSTPDELGERFGADIDEGLELRQRWNVAPTTLVPVVRTVDGTRSLAAHRWGLIPHWTTQLKGARTPFNARVETVHEKPTFRTSFARRRCLVPADGFYEWEPRGDGAKKQPWYIHDPERRPLAFAGIWRTWTDPESGDAIDSCTILTTEAEGLMSRLHHRMPVVLPERLWDTWLVAEERDAPYLHEVVSCAGTPDLRAHEVTDRVNSVRNDGPELVEPGVVDGGDQPTLLED